MFVFKAAVVGAGTMGGEIAQAIASSDIPVVLKDIDQKFVDHGLEKAREVTKGQLDRLVKKEKLTQEQADARLEEVIGLIEGTTTYDSLRRRRLRDRGGAGEDGDQAGGLRRARRGHARARDPRLEHLVALDHRDGRRDAAAREGRRLPLLLPGLGDAAGRDHRGRGDRPRDRPGRLQLRPDDPQAADHLRRGARASSSTGSSTRRSARSGAPRRSRGSRSRRSTRPSPPRTSRRWGRSSSSTCSASTRSSTSPSTCSESYGDSLLRPRGDAEARRRRQARREVGRRGLLRERRAADRGRRRARRRGARRADEAEGGRRGLPGARGGRLHGPRHRPRDDGRRRHGPAPRDLPAVHGRRHARPRRRPREARGGRGAARRALRAADGAQAPRRPGPPRAEVRPGLLRLPAGRRGRADRHGQARDARRRRDRLAREPADERDLAAGDQGPGHGLGAGQGRRARSGRW